MDIAQYIDSLELEVLREWVESQPMQGFLQALHQDNEELRRETTVDVHSLDATALRTAQKEGAVGVIDLIFDEFKEKIPNLLKT